MSDLKATQITWHQGTIAADARGEILKQQGCTLWFTGLSGSGKSTLAVALEQQLISMGHAAYVLDGDNVRFGLNASPKVLVEKRNYTAEAATRFGLTFSAIDRVENIRRISEVSKLFADAGLITLTSFISPYRQDRDAARTIHEQHPTGPLPFIEVYVSTDISVCESRDPKGLYKQARATIAAGGHMNFTGIDDPYEAPINPEITIDTGTTATPEAVNLVIRYLQQRGILKTTTFPTARL